MSIKKIPTHVWWGVAFPVVLVGLGIWRLWPQYEEYKDRDERDAYLLLNELSRFAFCEECRGYQLEWDIKAMEYRNYAFTVVQRRKPTKPSGGDLRLKNAFCHRKHEMSVYALCAYPIKYNWRHRRTFICAEDLSVLGVDNGGIPATEWPTDEELAEEWEKVQ